MKIISTLFNIASAATKLQALSQSEPTKPKPRVMEKILTAIAIGLAGGWTVARAGEALKAHPDSRSWPDLFTADLSNAIYPAGVWSWKDRELSPKDKDEAIWSKQEYENFILDLEFKMEPGANSGVFLYNTNLANWVTNHVEIQILDDSAPKWAKIPPNWKCGGIFGHSVPMKSVVKKAGEWNRMTIRCQGPAISVLLNGELVTDVNLKDCKSGTKNPDGSDVPSFEPRPLAEMPTKGRIGLQGAHGGHPDAFPRH